MSEQIAGLWPDDRHGPVDLDGASFQMPNGREYCVSRSLLRSQPNVLVDYRSQLTRYIDENPGESPVNFTTHQVRAILQRSLPSYSDRASRVLRALIARLGGRPGQLKFSRDEGSDGIYPLMRAGYVDFPELHAILQYWMGRGLIDYRESSSSFAINIPVQTLIALEDELRSSESDTAFVAMWFGPEMSDTYNQAIAPAIEHLGYRAVRIDQREHNNKIDDEIIAEIRRARFLVADFSCGIDGARGGVYYEAGFASGLGKPVIYTVREADFPRLHFDTRQYNHIVWKDISDLREGLKNRIGATIGARE